MKNFVYLLVLAATFIIAAPQAEAQREYSKECVKKAEKMAKTKAKELKKDGYKCSAAASLEDALFEFYRETGDCGTSESATVDINNSNSLNIGRNAAQEQIHRQVVKRFRDEIMGGGESNIEDHNTGDSSISSDDFSTKLVHKYKSRLNNVAREMLMVYKKNAAGRFDVTVFYALNKTKLAALDREISEEFDNSGKRADSIRDEVRKTHDLFDELDD
ncbi:MAG: hypothetical protein K2L32_09435 [Muribaculaceae bacterium]|nr:hypothetical protein [Muribaculaceae bacterium]